MTPNAPGLELSVERLSSSAGPIAILEATGEIDLANADQLAALLASDACVESRAVVVDLAGVPFMDSSGLRALLVAASQKQAKLALIVGQGSAVLRLLELAEVTDRIPVFFERDEALGALP